MFHQCLKWHHSLDICKSGAHLFFPAFLRPPWFWEAANPKVLECFWALAANNSTGFAHQLQQLILGFISQNVICHFIRLCCCWVLLLFRWVATKQFPWYWLNKSTHWNAPILHFHIAIAWPISHLHRSSPAHTSACPQGSSFVVELEFMGLVLYIIELDTTGTWRAPWMLLLWSLEFLLDTVPEICFWVAPFCRKDRYN
jgi:hypothetical protein